MAYDKEDTDNEQVEALRGLEGNHFRVMSGYFSQVRDAYEEVDEKFNAEELLEESEASSRRTRQVLEVMEAHEVVDELEEDTYRKNGHDVETIDRDLEILRSQE